MFSSSDLPLELILVISAFSKATDMAHFLGASRQLQPMLQAESLWREFSMRFAVDGSHVARMPEGMRTFRYLYTHLLHAYGPLLGLWASDFPFRGRILQFRMEGALDTPDGAAPAIVGEVWCFPPERLSTVGIAAGDESDDEEEGEWEDEDEDEDGDGEGDDSDADGLPMPSFPRFVRILRIAPDGPPTTAPVRTTCGIGASCSGESTMSSVLAPPTELAISAFDRDFVPLSSTFPSLIADATFPRGDRSPWLDRARAFILPRLRDTIPPDPAGFQIDASTHTLAEICVVPSRLVPDSLSPQNDASASDADTDPCPSLQIHCTTGCCKHVHMPTLIDAVSAQTGVPRYWPIRSETPPAAALDADWDPAYLAGLWLGDYSAHGTEVIFVEHCVLPPVPVAARVAPGRRSGFSISVGEYDDSEDETDEEVDKIEVEVEGRGGPVLRAWKLTGDVNVPRGALTWSLDVRAPVTPGPDMDAEGAEFAAGLAGPSPSKWRAYRGTATVAATGYQYPRRIRCVAAVRGTDEFRMFWSTLHHWSTFVRYKGRQGQ